jgi:NAD(P)-dependent dehydrogenase (short-subunit alcohol dehydrogenase family)
MIHSIQHRGPGYLSLFEDTPIEQLDLQVAVNLMSAVRACKILVPHMKDLGGGIIILVTSAAGELDANNMPGMPGHASTGLGYPMTKAGQIRFMMSLAKEVRRDNIAVIGLDPGFIFSEHVEVGRVGHDYQGWDSRLALPMDVPAETARYLCTCRDPMWYSGKNVRAAEFVQEHCLWPLDRENRK